MINWDKTPGLDDALRSALAAGDTAGQAAHRLHVRFGIAISRNSVIGRASRTGLKLQNPPSINRKAPIMPKRERKPIIKTIVVMRPVRRTAGPEPVPISPVEDFGDGCKWIGGDPCVRGWRECGHARLDGSPYCPHHDFRARATVKPMEIAA